MATKAATAVSTQRRIFIFKQTVGIKKSSKDKRVQLTGVIIHLFPIQRRAPLCGITRDIYYLPFPADASVISFSEGSSPGGLKKTGIILPVSGCTLALEEEKKTLDHPFHA